MKAQTIRCTLAALAVTMALPGLALAQGRGQQELDRGAMPDRTPQQRYNSAVREAGGGMKIGMAECRGQAGGSRKACEQEVQSRYKADMSAAREMLRNPNARPVNEMGAPIRSTETEIPIKP